MAAILPIRLARAAGLVFLLLGASTLASPPSLAQSAPGPAPTEVIQQFYNDLLDTMKQAQALGVRGRYQKLEPVIARACDLPFMAKLTIGPSWAGLTPDQKQQAAKAYGRYLTAVYAIRFDGYSGERFESLGTEKIKHGLWVKTRIIQSDGSPISINYLVHDNGVGWQVRDVYEAGSISELATQRSDFTQILRTGGINGLIAALNKKADDLQS
jgi:phospholipid transport system substrate-binding protein